MSTVEERCSCVAAREDIAVERPSNAPGLSAVAYRIGRHADFKKRLLAGLSDKKHGALAGLQTRGDDDFTIALLDAFATMADVLTFYQERLVNESYLRTATERRSVLELARLTGYRPSPGVAAGVALAFTLEDAPGAAEPPVQKVAIPVGAQVRSVPGPDETAQTFETVEAITARYEWNALEPITTQVQTLSAETPEIWVEGLNTGVQVGDGLLLRNSAQYEFRTVVAVSPDTTHGVTCLRLSSKLEKVFEIKTDKDSKTVVDPQCLVLRQRAAVFGHNAPKPCLLNLTKNVDAGGLYTGCEWTERWNLSGRKLDLDAVYSGIGKGQESFCVLVMEGRDPEVHRINQVSEHSISNFALSGKSTRLTLSGDLKGFERRETTIYLQSEPLALSGIKPFEEKVRGSTVTVQGRLETPRPAKQLGVVLEADGKGGWAPRELIEVQGASIDGENTRLTLASPMAESYAPANVRINLNIARATHGETVHEILGSGDARIPCQRFSLKQPPLTYVPTDSIAGSESTLEVRVDDLLWTERESFADAGPRDRVYTQSIADDGTVTLQFGDGVNGARLPSGQSNVRARYRKGLGLDGLVDAGQLSLLMTRPLGVKAVVNPRPAAGAEDPETLDTARGTAPTRVLTLDRAVSLKDYEDFARTFPGIAKARADIHPARAETILVTVAGAKSAEVDSMLAQRLTKALLTAGNPHLTIRVLSYRPVPFELAARIQVHPSYLKEQVAAAVATALTDAISFERATLGGSIWRSQVVALIQRVAGVTAADIERFARISIASPVAPVAPAPHSSAGSYLSVPFVGWGVSAQAQNAKQTPPYAGWGSPWQGFWDASPVADVLTANTAEPQSGLGAELLTLDPANLALDTVDAL